MAKEEAAVSCDGGDGCGGSLQVGYAAWLFVLFNGG